MNKHYSVVDYNSLNAYFSIPAHFRFIRLDSHIFFMHLHIYIDRQDKQTNKQKRLHGPVYLCSGQDGCRGGYTGISADKYRNRSRVLRF